jgi:hypothetical protein
MENPRNAGEALDPQDEILQACCNALDKAHRLLDFIARYDGKVTPEFIAACKDWVDGEYDPGERAPKPCKHNWVKARLDSSMWCSRCGTERSVGCQ